MAITPNLIQSNIKTMTLKEITDLLDVRHDKSMIKVERMAQDPEFGAVSKMDIVYNDQGQTTETYILDKRQSMAVSAALNTALLMRVIDRWQELESAAQQPAVSLPDFSNPAAAARAWAEQYEISTAAQEQLQIAAPKVEYHDKVLASDNGLLTTEIASELGMSAIALNRLLRDLKVQRKVGSRWVLTAAMLGQGLTTEDTFIDEYGKSRHSMLWTEKGRKLIHELLDGASNE